MDGYEIRVLTAEDQAVLWELLYVALWDAPDEPRRPRSVLEDPRIRRLVEDWGRPEDYALGAVEVASGQVVGAIWSRLDRYDQLDDFGCSFPCLGIGIFEAHQGRGLGRALMAQFIKDLRLRVPGLRLGANPKNDRARALYEKMGFVEYAIGGGGYPQMRLDFSGEG